MVTCYIESINITVITQIGDISMANKIDIYYYDTATDVRTLTLSNCTSTNVNDYMVLVNREHEDGISLWKPTGISGSTMTLKPTGGDSDVVKKVTKICVIQQGD